MILTIPKRKAKREQAEKRDAEIRRLYYVKEYTMDQIVQLKRHSKTTVFRAINGKVGARKRSGKN